MSKAWYFDAYEVTRVDVVGDQSKFHCAIMHRGRMVLCPITMLSDSFENANKGRIKVIAAMVEENRRLIDLAQADITKALTLLDQAIADDGVRE